MFGPKTTTGAAPGGFQVKLPRLPSAEERADESRGGGFKPVPGIFAGQCLGPRTPEGKDWSVLDFEITDPAGKSNGKLSLFFPNEKTTPKALARFVRIVELLGGNFTEDGLLDHPQGFDSLAGVECMIEVEIDDKGKPRIAWNGINPKG